MARVAKYGDTVSVHYTGKLTNGAVFDTSRKKVAKELGIFEPNHNYQPLTFTIGKGQVIKGFEEAVIGMRVGETKTVTIPPSKAYGRSGKHRLAGKTLVFDITLMEILS